MKIAVLMKQVPNEDAAIKIESEGKSIIEDNVTFITNEPDTYGLEEALLMKDKMDNIDEVVVCTMGPESAQQTIKDALAKGADRGIFISDNDIPNNDPLSIAKIITSAINYSTNIKVSDSQSGFRAYSKKAIDVIHPTEDGMSVSTEILLKISNKGLSIAEVPISISYDGTKSSQHPVSHGTSVFATTMKYVSIRHPLLFYGLPGIILFFTGLGLGVSFLDAYLYQQQVFYGSLLGSLVLILVGSVLILAAVLLYSMANLIRDKK